MAETDPPESPGLLSTRSVYKGRVVDLSVDRVRLPNGNVTDLELIRHPGAAVALPIEAGDDDIVYALLVRQYRYAADGWLLEVPGGKLDGPEDPETCVRREIIEEIGMEAGELIELGSILTTPGFTDERIWLYLARELTTISTGPSLEADEVLEVERVPLSEAVSMAVNGRITDAKTVACLLRAAAVLTP
jgi:ADP-ribose pyrophosphatase